MIRPAFAALLLLVCMSPALVYAQSDACVEVCGVSCVKPWAIPDRWDNFTGIPGYMGEGSGRRRNPEWRGNDHWDHEQFADANGNFRYDAGESYVDANGNGSYDEELYDSNLTGYMAHPTPGHLLSPLGDLGHEIVLHFGTTLSYSVPGQYLTIALPPVNKGIPVTDAEAYRANISDCNPALVEPEDRLQLSASGLVGPSNQGMRDLIAQDPDAYWDNTTQSVQGSDFPLSPRTIFVAAYDPRIPGPAIDQVVVAKVLAFFMEQMTGPAEVRGRLLRSIAPGGVATSSCAAGQVGGFIVDCPVPATSASWGQVKATYR